VLRELMGHASPGDDRPLRASVRRDAGRGVGGKGCAASDLARACCSCRRSSSCYVWSSSASDVRAAIPRTSRSSSLPSEPLSLEVSRHHPGQQGVALGQEPQEVGSAGRRLTLGPLPARSTEPQRVPGRRWPPRDRTRPRPHGRAVAVGSPRRGPQDVDLQSPSLTSRRRRGGGTGAGSGAGVVLRRAQAVLRQASEQ